MGLLLLSKSLLVAWCSLYNQKTLCFISFPVMKLFLWASRNRFHDWETASTCNRYVEGRLKDVSSFTQYCYFSNEWMLILVIKLRWLLLKNLPSAMTRLTGSLGHLHLPDVENFAYIFICTSWDIFTDSL